MLKNLITGEQVKLVLKEDMDPVMGIFEGFSKELGFVTIVSSNAEGWKSVSFVDPAYIKEIEKNELQ